jgi:hypothetical protein
MVMARASDGGRLRREAAARKDRRSRRGIGSLSRQVERAGYSIRIAVV